MNILNSIKLSEEDKIYFDQQVELIEQLEAATTNYSINVENALKQMLKRLENNTTGPIAKTTTELFYVLNRLSYRVFCNVMHYLDLTYPGMSLHMLMEARHQKSSISNIPLIAEESTLLRRNSYNKILTENDEYSLFYERVKKSLEKNLLKYLILPIRHKLIKGLLEDSIKEKMISLKTLHGKEILDIEFYEWLKNKGNDVELIEGYINDYLKEEYLEITLIPRVLTEEEFLDKINKVAIISEED